MQATAKITPAERAAQFNQLTRRHWMELGTKTGSENGVVSFDLPKARLLAGLRVLITATLTATHASATTYTPHEDAPFKFLKRAELSLNNGFAPFSISGQGLIPYLMSKRGVADVTPATSGRGNVVQGLTASSGGTANTVRFAVDLTNMLNKRDPIGLILLQNEETLATLNISLGAVADLAPASSGYTFAVSSISVTVLADTFSVPAVETAFPDLSVLKLVQERTETVIAGENQFKLPTGYTYRKIWFTYYDATPSRQVDSDITSTIDVLFNQAENPIRINPVTLAGINAEAYKGALPAGSYMLDFTDQGNPDLGNARDYIDTERITEFVLKFTAGAAGTIKIGYEVLSRLK